MKRAVSSFRQQVFRLMLVSLSAALVSPNVSAAPPSDRGKDMRFDNPGSLVSKKPAKEQSLDDAYELPEPSSIALFGLGALIGLAGIGYKRRKKGR